MNRYYLTSKEGKPVVVMPEMKMPYTPSYRSRRLLMSDVEQFRNSQEWSKWHEHIKSLPALPAVVPSPELLAVSKMDSFLECEEQYQLYDTYDGIGWHIVDKKWWKEAKNKLKQVYLVPVTDKN